MCGLPLPSRPPGGLHLCYHLGVRPDLLGPRWWGCLRAVSQGGCAFAAVCRRVGCLGGFSIVLQSLVQGRSGDGGRLSGDARPWSGAAGVLLPVGVRWGSGWRVWRLLAASCCPGAALAAFGCWVFPLFAAVLAVLLPVSSGACWQALAGGGCFAACFYFSCLVVSLCGSLPVLDGGAESPEKVCGQ